MTRRSKYCRLNPLFKCVAVFCGNWPFPLGRLTGVLEVSMAQTTPPTKRRRSEVTPPRDESPDSIWYKETIEIDTYKELHCFITTFVKLLEEIYELGVLRGEVAEYQRNLTLCVEQAGGDQSPEM